MCISETMCKVDLFAPQGWGTPFGGLHPSFSNTEIRPTAVKFGRRPVYLLSNLGMTSLVCGVLLRLRNRTPIYSSPESFKGCCKLRYNSPFGKVEHCQVEAIDH